ncbi:MAG: GlsB/YeaQ/YmgE family stress response membrane protein [Rhodospirillaceae bacterium]|nr:GlsB/YeaQ/YmgE family stress response membrane protein [Rhodospirillaceae bacterium]
MDLLGRLAILIVVGFAAGWIAATVLGERQKFGILGYIVVGAIGAIAGKAVFGWLHLPNVGFVIELIAGIVGAVVLVTLLRLLRR